jgi:hypothetical protein
MWESSHARSETSHQEPLQGWVLAPMAYHPAAMLLPGEIGLGPDPAPFISTKERPPAGGKIGEDHEIAHSRSGTDIRGYRLL